MKTTFLAQPDKRLGDLIEDFISKHGVPKRVIVVSAFAALTTVFRFKTHYAAVREAGGDARSVLGVDLGGTSKEVLTEVSGWQVPVIIVKNRFPGVTFHPKIYQLCWRKHAVMIVGSNNWTEGGMYRNSEAATLTEFRFPADQDAYDEACSSLERFLTPTGPTANLLTPDYLSKLLALEEIPSENAARKARGEQMPMRAKDDSAAGIFGKEKILAAPRSARRVASPVASGPEGAS